MAEEDVDLEEDSYEPSGQEDTFLLEADKETEDNPEICQTSRVWVRNQRYQHVQATKANPKKYSYGTAQLIAVTMTHFNETVVGMTKALKQEGLNKMS